MLKVQLVYQSILCPWHWVSITRWAAPSPPEPHRVSSGCSDQVTHFFSFLLRPFPCVAQAGSDFMILQLQLLWVSNYSVYYHCHFPGCSPYLTCGCYKCSHLWPQEKTPSSAETAEGTLFACTKRVLGLPISSWCL